MRPSAPAEQLDAAALRAWPLPLHDDDDKHARGTVLVIGGSPRTTGAVVLAGTAALRVGAGRLQIAVAEPAAMAVGVAVPEALVASLPVHADGRIKPNKAASALEPLLARADAVLVGPGLMSDESTSRFLHRITTLVGERCVVVLDAAAARRIDTVDEAVAPVRSRLAVVANRDEVGRLAEHCAVSADAGLDVGEVARRLGAVITCFGTVVAPDGRSWSCRNGTAGLGTSGSGDVLSGLVAGAAARCGDPAQAACWATYAHAEVGARLSARIAPVGFLAREIADEVPAVLRRLEGDPHGEHAVNGDASPERSNDPW